MFQATLQNHAEHLATQLFRDRDEMQFARLFAQPQLLPLRGSILLDFNPVLGGSHEIGGETYSFKLGEPNEETFSRMKQAMVSSWALHREEAQMLVYRALTSRMQCCLDPAGWLADLITRSEQADRANGEQFKRLLDGLDRQIASWDASLHRGVNQAKPYLLYGRHFRLFDRDALYRLFRSALDKEVSSQPYENIEHAVRSLMELFGEEQLLATSKLEDQDKALKQILRNRGLADWVAVLDLERETEGVALGFANGLLNLKRYHLYRRLGLLDFSEDELVEVQDEIRGFTFFLEELTQ